MISWNHDNARVRILIADDFTQWRIQIGKILTSRSDWEVIYQARNGQEALEKTLELRPDIVLLDIGMPVMNGLQAGIRIREHCPYSHIIFVTQIQDEAVIEAARVMGAAGYVLKTKIATELVAVIAAALAKKQAIPARF